MRTRQQGTRPTRRDCHLSRTANVRRVRANEPLHRTASSANSASFVRLSVGGGGDRLCPSRALEPIAKADRDECAVSVTIKHESVLYDSTGSSSAVTPAYSRLTQACLSAAHTGAPPRRMSLGVAV